MAAVLMNRIAKTDATFHRDGRDWIGKCLICGGPVRFDSLTGEGASVEHIVPRVLGGDNDLLNLGITHMRCNSEKGRRWDAGPRRRAAPERYQSIVARLSAERQRRWREALTMDSEWA